MNLAHTPRSSTLQPLVAATALSLLLGACTLGPRQADSGLHAQKDRITDAAMRGDLAAIQALQNRLQKVNADGVAINTYHYAKAQHWLDFARSEYHENDRTAVIEGALREARKLIEGLERKATLPMDTPIIATSVKLRDDLWAKAEALKKHPHFKCGEVQVAQFEVQLVWSGHELNTIGWRHATPYVGIAEDLAKDAEARINACATRVAAAPPPPPPAPAAPPPPPPKPVVERITLAADALFKFNKSDLASLLPEGRAKIDMLAASLRQFRQIESLRITGHADRFGSPAYNATLSAARAETVGTYLASKGLDRLRITTEGVGATQPVASCPGPRNPKTIACLAPNRRVDIEVRGLR
jgi:outer membrane protein OmpA-like peptidoglycan-associated protein